jgi:DUF1680 family protein
VSVRIDDAEVYVRPEDGYLRLTREWSATTRVRLRLAMPVRVLAAHPRVDAVRGCVALTRGPLVFSLEQADLPEGVVLEDVALDPSGPVTVVEHGAMAPIPVTLRAPGFVQDTGGPDLYRDATRVSAEPVPIPVTLVPYFLWGNRTPGAMRVWIPTMNDSSPRKDVR